MEQIADYAVLLTRYIIGTGLPSLPRHSSRRMLPYLSMIGLPLASSLSRISKSGLPVESVAWTHFIRGLPRSPTITAAKSCITRLALLRLPGRRPAPRVVFACFDVLLGMGSPETMVHSHPITK